jgi:hypothetical protein
MSLGHGASIVRNGLVMYLDAANTKSYPGSATTWTDLSGNGRNGTLINDPTYSSVNGGTIVFDGTNDYITSSFRTTSSQAITYCGWLYSTETGGTERFFVGALGQRPDIRWNSSGQITFDGGVGYTTSQIYRNQWVYVALSKPSDSAAPSYYVNGGIVGTSAGYTTAVGANTPYLLNNIGSSTWKGNCSILQVYNRALTAAEVLQNFNATRGRYGI